ncbi:MULTISPECIES: Crp/Fnr family transcriptional regulator [Mycobacterium]|jgi:CRP-like cAMP-binding protein|uniref:Transcriptional regulator n=1 Tax=Mycobacterium gordonae TaxID=1778 RepID=A0A1A6BBZ0_MYCGO|nr:MULTISPECIES: Crp/Fnr family transcriptional regulator [Mycobacterium]MBI2701783.1 Crp/Fnr family transcriptional regulator [Mycobacterium sp.]MBX9980227.1 Crp/Fnr family transcriptional regulator [Mycobacterium gordonae]MCQ4362458.1 Crp/Fnr family transcriptional regulator [Mycobacterium gordonae]MCV7005090.1 Crp/Fnr family transcriptional regulator [Mycobacterium gordonae]OBR99824.1 transcriptional regulator [Mycobacterium gordonae]
MSNQPADPLRDLAQSLGGGQEVGDLQLRHAAWVARCVGRGASAPLHPNDVSALAENLQPRTYPPGAVVFRADQAATGVCIVRQGRIELAVGSGRRRAVVDVLRPGDIDGDIHLLLDVPPPYTARTLTESSCLLLDRQAFDRLLAGHPAIARRWLSSVAQRVSASQARLIGLLGRPLGAQLAQLLLDEAVESRVELAQRTIAAMLGVRRPSINKVIKDFERNNVIKVGYAVIDIVDRDALAALAQ